MSYASLRLCEAVRHLATNPGDVRARLWAATEDLWLVSPQELPAELRTDFQWVQEMMTKYEPQLSHEGTIRATLRRMRNNTGVKIAEKIFEIHRSLERYESETEKQTEMEAETDGPLTSG
jgi:hypothetical protein